MNYIKKLLGLWAVGVVLAACGAPPVTEEEAAEFHEDDIGQLEQALTVGIGMGFAQGTSGDPCSSAGFCMVPRDRKLRIKLTGDTIFAAGFTLQSQFDIIGPSTCGGLNAQGWDCQVTTGSSNETVAPGSIGGAVGATMAPGNISGGFILSGSLLYRQFNSCSITISKSNIESAASYQALSTNNKKLQVQILIKHEIGHCAGLPNSPGSVMSQPTSLSQPSFTADQLALLASYRP